MHKRFSHILLIIFLFCLAQFEGFSQIRIGAKGGVNFSGFYEEAGYVNFKDRVSGKQAGLILDIGLIPKFVSFQTEVLFSQKGSYKDDQMIKLNYLEFPASLKINIPVFSLYLHGGGYLAYCGDAFMDDYPLGFNNNLQRMDVGYHMGLGFYKSFKVITFFIEARYSQGVSELKMLDFDGSPYKNMNVGITAGILLGPS